MKISAIQSFRLNGINTNFKGKEKPATVPVSKPDELKEISNVCYGREMLNLPTDDFNQTLKENYFKLPPNCSPDEFQLEAGRALLEGKDVLTSAPTGTGKTAIAHYAVSKNMAEGKTTFYTTPIKALSNQKLNEFRAVYGDDNVGIMTGDRRENVEAPVVIMTTEVFRNMALSNMNGEKNPLFDKLGTVIFDEFHYLGDEDRGPAWEESVMMAPKGVQKLALSATIGNYKDLNGWLGSLAEKDSKLVAMPEEARHVPLKFDDMYTGAYRMEAKREQRGERKNTGRSEDDLYGAIEKPTFGDFKLMVNRLRKKDQLPAILFVFSRGYSKELLDYFSGGGEDLTTNDEKNQIEKIVNEYQSKRYIGSDIDLKALKKGYAIHNAGIIPAQKELIEELFQKKLLKTVIATETLAAGINMPAKTVVISSPYKPSGSKNEKSYTRPLTANEFKQMAGRAGRRGIDTVGYVYTMPTNKSVENTYEALKNSESNPVYSNYDPDYAFLAGYYEHNGNTENLEKLSEKSFYVYSEDPTERAKRADELATLAEARTEIMKKRGLIVENNGEIQLTKTGYIASKVRGYDAISLAETVESKAFDKISPEALAMVAAGMANPATPLDPSISTGTDLLPIFDKLQENVDSVYSKLYGNVNRTLQKLGKDVNSFSSYDEMIDFVKSIEGPDESEDELRATYSDLKDKMNKMYIVQSKEKYSRERLVNELKDGQTVPSRTLNEHYNKLEKYKTSLKGTSIEDHIEDLQENLACLGDVKGNKAKALLEKKREQMQEEIEEAQDMLYLDSRITDEMGKNQKFLKDNKDLKAEYRACEKEIIRLTSQDVLLSRVEGLKNIDEYQFEHDLISEGFQDNAKASKCFDELVKRSGSVYGMEMNAGISGNPVIYNRLAAENIFNWAMLNRINSDSMSNWKQVLKAAGDVQEGAVYRQVLQTADLLSQIEEMARAGLEVSDNEADNQYYTNLRETALVARQLMINTPVEV